MGEKVNRKQNKYRELMPPLIREAESDVQLAWIKWYKLGEELKNHPLRFYTIQGRDDQEVIDCSGILGTTIKKARKHGATEEDITEITRRVKIIKKAQVEKGKLTRQVFNKDYKEKLKMREADALNAKEARILEMFGRYMGVNEIYSFVRREWGLNIEKVRLQEFYENNKGKIEHLRSDYVLRNREFNIATDTGRMETLAKLHDHWLSRFDSHPTLPVSREITSILEQVRKEIKGDELKLTINGRIDIHATQQANIIIDEVLHKLPIQQMIIGMVAAKRGLNPAKIIESLTTSFYRKYNGFTQLTEEKEPDPSIYVKNYDFGHLKRQVDDNKFNIEEAEIVEDLPYEKKLNVQDRRAAILAKIEQFKRLQNKNPE